MCYQLHQTAVCRVSVPAHTLSEGVPVFADCQLIHTRHNYALWMTLKTTSSWGSPPPPAKIDRRNDMILSPKVHAYFSQRLTLTFRNGPTAGIEPAYQDVKVPGLFQLSYIDMGGREETCRPLAQCFRSFSPNA